MLKYIALAFAVAFSSSLHAVQVCNKTDQIITLFNFTNCLPDGTYQQTTEEDIELEPGELRDVQGVESLCIRIEQKFSQRIQPVNNSMILQCCQKPSGAFYITMVQK